MLQTALHRPDTASATSSASTLLSRLRKEEADHLRRRIRTATRRCTIRPRCRPTTRGRAVHYPLFRDDAIRGIDVSRAVVARAACRDAPIARRNAASIDRRGNARLLDDGRRRCGLARCDRRLRETRSWVPASPRRAPARARAAVHRAESGRHVVRRADRPIRSGHPTAAYRSGYVAPRITAIAAPADMPATKMRRSSTP